jgi:hypothetical protein
MKKRLATSTALLAALLAPPAHADDWGCQVLLCLANPAGPMAVFQCVPPIQRLYAAIFKWKPDPFPTCTMSNGLDSSSGGNYAYVGAPSHYDACPAGTSPAGNGAYVVAGRPATATDSPWAQGRQAGYVSTSSVLVGIGEGTGLSPSSDREIPMPQKVCVGNRVGSSTITTGKNWDDRETHAVTIYDTVVTLNPTADTFNINVMINNKLFTTVRPFSQSTVQIFTSN